VDAALQAARDLPFPLLAGELGGRMPPGFDMNNSPAELQERADTHRPVILLSSSGTRLISLASCCGPLFLACFRNYVATAEHLAEFYPRVALIGAGSRNEAREEDQICCAWIAGLLGERGYLPENRQTAEECARWRGADAYACLRSKSAAYLVKSGQSRDLDFVLTTVNDLEAVFQVVDGEVVMVSRRTTDRPARIAFAERA
jgi:2-phosphosulfolactate phosphatase